MCLSCQVLDNPTALAATRVRANGSQENPQGRPWLSKLLVAAAHAAAHIKNTYLPAFYHRIKARQGAKQAMMAVGHVVFVICYHVLNCQVEYQELGGNYFDEHERPRLEKGRKSM